MFTHRRHEFILSSLIAILGSAAPSMATSITVSTACSGAGIEGEMTESNVTIYFQSCVESQGWRSRIWSDTYPDQSEFMYHPTTDTADAWIDDVQVTESLSEEEQDAMDIVLESDEGEVAAGLHSALIDLGFDEDNEVVAALGGHVHAYKYNTVAGDAYDEPCYTHEFPVDFDCTSEQYDCLGCCGMGCPCSGTCTQSCYNHDCCMRTKNRPCVWKFIKAAISSIGCDMGFRAEENCDGSNVNP